MARKGISVEEKLKTLTNYLITRFEQGNERIVLDNKLCITLLNNTSAGVLQFLRYEILAQKKNIVASLDRQGRGRERLGRQNAPMCYSYMSDEEFENYSFVENDFRCLTVEQINIIIPKLKDLGFNVWDRYIFLLMIDLFYMKNNANNWAYISPYFYSEYLLKSQAEIKQMFSILCNADLFVSKSEDDKAYYKSVITEEERINQDTGVKTEILTYAEGRKKTYLARKHKAQENNGQDNAQDVTKPFPTMFQGAFNLLGTQTEKLQQQNEYAKAIEDSNQIAIRPTLFDNTSHILKQIYAFASQYEDYVNNDDTLELRSDHVIEQEYNKLSNCEKNSVGAFIEYIKNPDYRRVLRKFNTFIEMQEKPVAITSPALEYKYYKRELIGQMFRSLLDMADIVGVEENDLQEENQRLREALDKLQQNNDKSSKVFDIMNKQLTAIKEENGILKKRYKDMQQSNKQILEWQSLVQKNCEEAIDRFNGEVATEIGILAQSNNFNKDRGKFSTRIFALLNDLTRAIQRTSKIKSVADESTQQKNDWDDDDWH